jgi:hypothetical protein
MGKWILFLVLTTMTASGLSKLEAISMIETGDNDRAVGRAGEVSRYQIRPEVWRQYSDSFAYGNREIASTVAEKHMLYLETLFRTRTGREATDFDLYVLWNAGAGYYERVGFAAQRVGRVIRDRAQRYFNLRHFHPAQEAQDLLYASRLK